MTTKKEKQKRTPSREAAKATAKKSLCGSASGKLKENLILSALMNLQDDCGKMIEKLFNYFAKSILQKILPRSVKWL